MTARSVQISTDYVGALRILLVAAVIGSVALLFVRLVHPFLESLAWALIIVLMTWPLFSRLQGRLPLSRSAAALIMSALVLASLTLLVVPALIELGREVHGALNGKGSVDIRVLAAKAAELPIVGVKIAEALQSLSEEKSAGEFVARHDALLELLTQGARGVGAGVASLFLAIFFSFFLYRDGPEFAKQLKRVFLHSAGRRGLLFLATAVATLRGSVYGTLVTALAQGLLAGFGYWLFGAPTPVLLGFATGIFSFIPFGAPMIYLPVSFYVAFASGPWHQGLLLAIWGTAFVSTADNILRPFFISQATRMPLPLVFIGVVGGIVSFGMLGVFLGPVLAALVLSFWNTYAESIARRERGSLKQRMNALAATTSYGVRSLPRSEE